LTGNLPVSVNTTSARRRRSPAGGCSANAVHDCRPRVFVCRHTGGLTTRVGGRAGGMSWCGHRSKSMEWMDHPWSHWSDHPTRSPKHCRNSH